MKSGSAVLLDFLLNFIVNSYFLAVYYFFNALAVCIFTSNLSSNLYSLEVIFFLNSQCDQTLSNFADLFCSGFSCFDEVAPKYVSRNGGYTRIVKIGQRKGDAAMEVLLELV